MIHEGPAATDLAGGVDMRVLITGGAGYVGSHVVLRLAEGGHEAVVKKTARAKKTFGDRTPSW